MTNVASTGNNAVAWRHVRAEILCLSCAHEWSGKTEAVACPACGHLYASLTNFVEMVERYGIAESAH
jgi:Zn finger protein HypA/HybF involved in hydrogenase expression